MEFISALPSFEALFDANNGNQCDISYCHFVGTKCVHCAISVQEH